MPKGEQPLLHVVYFVVCCQKEGRTVNAAGIHAVYEEALCEMPDGNSVKKGDLVICSVNGKNFTEPCGLGKVHTIKDVKLVATHNDGPKGEVFVLSYDKQKMRGKTSLASLKSKLH